MRAAQPHSCVSYGGGSLPDWFWMLVVFGYGAFVGSFLNVVIYRLPLGYSISSPPSHCPRCNEYLRLWDNIPIFAFLALGARCRYCRTPIGWRYFTVELMTACLWLCLFHRVTGATMGATSLIPLIAWTDFLFQALFASVLVALIFIDLDHFFVPDELNGVAFAFALIRDIGCIVLAKSLAGDTAAPLYLEKLAWFGWLPRAFPGALVYGGVLFFVSVVGFVYYARGDNESPGAALRRFFTMEDLPEDDIVLLETTGKPGEEVVPEEEVSDGEPIRLRFAPAFLAFVAALLTLPVIGWYSLLVFVLPWVAFTLMTPLAEGESRLHGSRRFFRVADLPMDASKRMVGSEYGDVPKSESSDSEEALEGEMTITSEDAAFVTLSPTERATVMASEADQFAKESESGKHGGMGLGDVKLALAIGALLGPGMALLSLMFATFSGAVIGILLARIHGKGLRYGLPFVPFMAFGAILTMLYGDSLVTWYLNRSGLEKPPAAMLRTLPPLGNPEP